MFSPINVRLHSQGQGAPLIDQCTTVRKFDRDDGTGSIHVTYRGWSICPLWFLNRTGAIAVTRKVQTHFYMNELEAWSNEDEGKISG